MSSKMAPESDRSAPTMEPPPRLVTRHQAAAYCNLSPGGFSSLVRTGKLPPPLPGTTRWDLKAIDAALDPMSGLQPQKQLSALDEWRAKRARRTEGIHKVKRRLANGETRVHFYAWRGGPAMHAKPGTAEFARA